MPISLPARTAAALMLTLAAAAPLAAQDANSGYSLPQATPTPTPAPAGPADERAGVAIPPRAVPAPRIEPAPVLVPEVQPASPAPAPVRAAPRPAATRTAAPPSAAASPAATPTTTSTTDPLALPPAVPNTPPPQTPPSLMPEAQPTNDAAAAWLPEGTLADLPDWWPFAAGGAGALVLLGGGAWLWRRRRRAPLRLAAPVDAPADAVAALPLDTALDITLDITAATRSLMMFTLEYRLTASNRSEGAITDISAAVQLTSARHGDGNAASPGAAQALFGIERIGPFQSHTITGAVRLPLTDIAVLRQGRAALFIPLLHVTLEGRGQAPLTRSFVIGTPSTMGTGRLHPLLLDTAPGSIAGLTAQPITIPAISAAA